MNTSAIIGGATCATCRFALPASDQKGHIDWGKRFCRGGTPEPIVVGVNPQSGPIVHWCWPVVGAKDWCGVHKPRDIDLPLPGEVQADQAEEKPQ